MDRLTQFFRSFRTLAFFGALAATMLPWPGLTSSAVAGQTPVGADTSLRGGTWWNDIWIARPAFHALADVNGDGFADLIYTLTASLNTAQTNVYVQYSNGSSFGAPVVVAADASTLVANCDPDNCTRDAQALINAVGDVNGDGRPDILFADGTVALGNGSGFGPKTAWGGDTSLRGGTWWNDIWVARPAFHALADVNGDGFADLIYTITASLNTAQTNVYVQYSNGSSFGAPVVVAADASTLVANCDPDNCTRDAQALINAVGDVNGDGRPDILFADGTVALGNGSGFGPKTAWGGDTSLRGGTWWNDVWVARPAFHALADVNGDGFADLIYTLTASLGTPQTNVYVQYSNGSSFGASLVVATDASTLVANCDPDNCTRDAQALINAVGDINGDGQKDLLFANGAMATVPTPSTPATVRGRFFYYADGILINPNGECIIGVRFIATPPVNSGLNIIVSAWQFPRGTNTCGTFTIPGLAPNTPYTITVSRAFASPVPCSASGTTVSVQAIPGDDVSQDLSWSESGCTGSPPQSPPPGGGGGAPIPPFDPGCIICISIPF